MQELLMAGYLQPSKSLFGTLILFQKKNDSLMLCVDYKALNRITIHSKYHVPNVKDLMCGYHQLWIREGDEPKMACD